jgi:hypothetical protein
MGKREWSRVLEKLIVAYRVDSYLIQWSRTLLEKLIVVHRMDSSLTPWSRVHLEKLSVVQLVEKFPAFYGI